MAAISVEVATGEIPKVLARNTACHQCRRRKLKCDATRPICINCAKPRVRGVPADQSPESCSWDEPKDAAGAAGPRKKRSRGSPEGSGRKAKLDDLEERIASFEHNLGAKRSEPDTASQLVFDWTSTFDTSINSGGAALADAGITSTIPIHDQQPLLDNAFLSDMSALVWPDWPRELPSYETVEHCVSVFFDKIPTLPKMMHKPTFFANLQLPPSHPKFPAQPLLHAILAITANHISEVSLGSRAFFPSGTPAGAITHPDEPFETPSMSSRYMGMSNHQGGRSKATAETPFARFQLWHRRLAWETMTELFDKGLKLLQILQAHAIATAVDQYNAWWVDVWMEAGSCVRAAIPLELNESPSYHKDSLVGFKKQLIPPAATPLDQAERDRTWWVVYTIERAVGSSCPWPSAIQDSEVTVELPVLQSTFDFGAGELQGVQTLQSPDLYTFTPPRHVDSLTIYIKALKLYSDAQTWFRLYTRGQHAVSKYVADPQLRLLLSQINAFRLSWPAPLRRPTQVPSNQFDADLIAAHMMTHGATIALGEPLVTKEHWTNDIARVALSAVRAILSLLYDITATSYDVTLLPPCCSWIWALSVRCLCRFITAAGENGDFTSVAVFSSEIEVFRLTMNRYGERYPVGVRHAAISEEIFNQQSEMLDICTPVQLFDHKYRPGAPGTVGGGGAAHIVSGSTPLSSSAVFTPSGRSATGSTSGASMSNPASTSGLGASPAAAFAFSASPSDGFFGATNSSTTAATTAASSASGLGMGMGPNAMGPNGLLGTDPKTSAAMTGFDISSFSFDFDAVAELFASAGAVFDGTEYVFKAQ